MADEPTGSGDTFAAAERIRASSLLNAAVEAIDAANADDPVQIEVGGRLRPKEVVHAERMTHWVLELDPDATDDQLIAARAHHLRRWVVPRSTFPDGRQGYLKWRVAQRQRQVQELTELLAAVGCPAEVIERASTIVAKKGITSDPAVQTHEDALCLVFLELQIDELAERLDRDHMVEVLRKSLEKMSERGIAAAGSLPMSDEARDLVARAVDALRG
jgi:hypothetical protein